MDRLFFRRWKQILTYGWRDSAEIAKEASLSRGKVFADILSSFSKWYVFSNQYRTHRMWELKSNEKQSIAIPLGMENKRLDEWRRQNYHNWKFLKKWTDLKYELSPSRQQKRKEAYTKEFNAGEGLTVQYNVHIHREHFLDGTIRIGKNVVLAKNVFIDYTGEVIIGDNVHMANGVIIESHHRDLEAYDRGKDVNIPTKLIIQDNAYIGSRAIILDTCNYIGKNARVGAGAVVTKDVPDFAVVVGVPAKVIKYVEP